MLSTSYVFTLRVRYHCTYFSFFWIVFFLHPLLFIRLPLFPFFFFVYLLCQHDPPQKEHKSLNLFLLTKPGRFSRISLIPYFMGKCSFMLPSATNFWIILIFKISETLYFRNVDTQILRGHRGNTSKKDAPGPLNPIFIVFCDLHPYIKTQLLEKFSSRGVKNGPFFRTPHLHVEEHHHHNPHVHISWHHRPHFSHPQNLPNTYFCSAKLTWLVG